MADVEKFREAYARFELAAREAGSSAQAVEESLGEDERDKLRLCRAVRNYAAHRDDGRKFAAASDEMVAFMDKLAARAKASRATAGSLARKARPIGPAASVLEAAAAARKDGFVAVVDDGGFPIGTADAETVVRAVAKAKSLDAPFVGAVSKKELRESLGKARTAYADEPLDPTAAGEPTIVLKKDGRYAGIVDWRA